jgi:trk system potassium uptake protein TrkH
MRYGVVISIIGFILMLFSISTIIPVAISLFYKDGGTNTFLIAGLAEAVVGFGAWFMFRKSKRQLKTRDGFLIVAVVWMVLSLFAAVPFYISPLVHESFVNSIFESVSGLTTTGASISQNLSDLPHAVLFYRQELQFFGGMGIVVLAVAVMPMLGIGGMQLYKAETPGPMKESKLTPRITETAKALWFIYLLLTVACALAYWLAGMKVFDAIGESFGTISTGGFSMHNSSFSYYHSDLIDLIATVFMFLSSVNFSLHFLAFQQRNVRIYWRDVEFRYYVGLLFVVTFFTVMSLYIHHYYINLWQDTVKGLFTVVSLISSTGFNNGNFAAWPSYIPYLLIIASLIGACGGSTSGGMKTMRFVLVCKLCALQFKKLIHPNGVYPLKFGRQIISRSLIESMLSFVAIYIAFLVVATLCLLASGLDLTTSFSSVAIAIANVGAGLGSVADGFYHLGVFAKVVLIITMLAGRLEIFTLLLLFTPAFWRK